MHSSLAAESATGVIHRWAGYWLLDDGDKPTLHQSSVMLNVWAVHGFGRDLVENERVQLAPARGADGGNQASEHFCTSFCARADYCAFELRFVGQAPVNEDAVEAGLDQESVGSARSRISVYPRFWRTPASLWWLQGRGCERCRGFSGLEWAKSDRI